MRADREYTQRFSVSYEYPVYFTDDVFETGNPIFATALSRIDPVRAGRSFFVIDEGVIEGRPRLLEQLAEYVEVHPNLELSAPAMVVPGGEGVKGDPRYVEELQRALIDHHVDRHSFVVIVGGGAVLDMAGFAAATCHRGLRTVRIPTTVLSQNDSGVGVKNGINAYGAKNVLGTFSPPCAVIDDIAFIRTLPERDRRAGLAEAIKVALIKDRAFFEWLERSADRLDAFDEDATAEMIRRSAALHLEHIATSGDPFELGSARPLDYGHWAAHKLEILSGHRLRHGEAVAIGMALDARYAVTSGLLPERELMRICGLLERLHLPLFDEALVEADILIGLEEFREHLGGELTIFMLTEIGRGIDVHQMDQGAIESSIRWLDGRYR
jgi:3-dehydroquinate synthase